MSKVYGPVLSWRFGRSLGIDLISGVKTCTFDCIYCQLGRTQIRVSKPEDLESHVSASEIIKDLERYLHELDLSYIDVITFSGTGEPTLNPEIGRIAKIIKDVIPRRIPLVLLTNSSLLYREDVSNSLLEFDIVCTKLDAGDEKSFKIINRPAQGIPSIKVLIDAIKRFRKEFPGKLMLQTMFLHTDFGFTNCQGLPFENLLNAIIYIDPDVVQIDTPYRPGGEPFVSSATKIELLKVSRRLEEYFNREDIWVFGFHDKRNMRVAWKRYLNIENKVLNLLMRRPCRLVDIVNILNINEENALRVIERLIKEGIIKVRIINNERYYMV